MGPIPTGGFRIMKVHLDGLWCGIYAVCYDKGHDEMSPWKANWQGLSPVEVADILEEAAEWLRKHEFCNVILSYNQ